VVLIGLDVFGSQVGLIAKHREKDVILDGLEFRLGLSQVFGNVVNQLF